MAPSAPWGLRSASARVDSGGRRGGEGRPCARCPPEARMPRAARRRGLTEAACYHVLNRGHARETVFHDDEDRAHFLRLLARYRDRFGFSLYYYCLMGGLGTVQGGFCDP